MSIWLLYLMTRTEAIAEKLEVFAFVSITFTGIGLFLFPLWKEMIDITELGEKRTFVLFRRLIIAAVVAASVSSLLPSRKDWYLMIGGYYVTHIEGIDQLPQNMVGAMNEFLKEYGQPESKPEPKGHGV